MTKRKPKSVKANAIVGVDSNLTIKQRLFIDHYIVCMNATEAARRAGYEGDNATLANTGSQNLRNPYILTEIDNRLKKYAMSANEVLAHITDIARGDIADALNTGGYIDPLEAKRRGKSHMIKRFKRKTKTITTTNEKSGEFESEILEDEHEIEMYDRLDALKTLAKFHSLLVNRIQVDDWHSQALADIKAGHLTYEILANGFDAEFATQLFTEAGIRIPSNQERE